MLPVYLESNFIKTISDEQLPTDVAQLQKYILSTLSVDSCSHVDIYDITGQRVIQGEIEPIWLSYAVVSLTAEAAIKWKPVKVTLRQTDKTGHLLFKHPTTSIAELKRTIESLTGVPVEKQALFYGGSPLEDTCSTIEQVGLRQSSMVHLLDLRKLPTGLGEYFMVNLQPAQSGLQSYEIEVSSGFDVRRLKECASELFQIPLQDLLLTYCGMILGRNDATLLEYKLVPGAFVNAINEKKSFKPRNEGQTIQVKLRETTRVVPNNQINDVRKRKESEATVASVSSDKENEGDFTVLSKADTKQVNTQRIGGEWTATVLTSTQ